MFYIPLLNTSNWWNRKWYGKRKKKRANNPRKNVALNTEKNAVYTDERYYIFAEEAIQFTVNGETFYWREKKAENASSYSG
ncbi:hypothetical protein TNCV_2185131 [Trichonephila clavipes]|nr:hypothetical protein TNCV_2185131 [Trichonephila clavipes]